MSDKLRAAEQPAQEPMHPEIKKMYEDYFDKCFRELSAQQRPWVGLTDEEVNSIYEAIEKVVGDHWENGGTKLMFPVTLYEALEAKLREKNNEALAHGIGVEDDK